jgi:cbb3-type cytochrome oxidase subunit 1
VGLNFLRIAVVYLFLGALLGLAMGITQKFVLAPVHAHLLLLGWASLALAGIVYHLYPPASATRLARMHFWLHNLGLPVFMIGLALVLTGTEAGLAITATGATVVLVGLALFSTNVLLNVKPAAR